jgi:hypothetical protein
MSTERDPNDEFDDAGIPADEDLTIFDAFDDMGEEDLEDDGDEAFI